MSTCLYPGFCTYLVLNFSIYLRFMYDQYFQTFKSKLPLTEEEQELIKNYLTLKRLRKKQYVLQEGEICKCVSFVEKGALRLYKVNEDGSEHIVQFALEGQFLTDLYSFLTNEAPIYNIDAIEESQLYSLRDQQVMNFHYYPCSTTCPDSLQTRGS